MVVGSNALNKSQVSDKMLIINKLYIELNYEKRHKWILAHPIST
jgi:hypothetical protein